MLKSETIKSGQERINNINIPKIIFIVPYRNRENDYTHFTVYMKYLLEDIPRKDYMIYISHQHDERAFNRGATKNIGFLAIREKYPNDYKDITFVFHDIDVLPYKKNLLDYTTVKGTVKHFYGFDYALGGIFSITGADFEEIKGFPNFWGWGWEDNVINKRCIDNGIIIDRSRFYPIAHPEFIHTSMQRTKLLNNKRPDINRCEHDNLDTLRDVKYSIIDDPSCNTISTIQIDYFNTVLDYSTNRFYIQDLVDNRVISRDHSQSILQKHYKSRWSLQILGK